MRLKKKYCIRENFLRFLVICVCLYLGLTVISVLLLDKSQVTLIANKMPVANRFLLPFIIAAFFIFVYVASKYEITLSSKTIIIAYGIVFSLQMVILYHTFFYTGWDAGEVRRFAYMFLRDEIVGENEYLQRWPNNIFLVWLLSSIIKITASFKWGYLSMSIVSCLSVNLSCLCGTIIINKTVKNQFVSCVAFILGTVVISFSPWIIIPYSDTLGMIFPMLAFLIYTMYNQNRTVKYITIEILCFIGYLVKPTIIICLIAFCVIEIIDLIAKKKLLYIAVLLGTLIGVCFLVSLGFGRLQKSMGIIKDPNKEFGITHYLMMGINSETMGGYNGQDTMFSILQPNKVERSQANIRVYKERFQEMGIANYIKFLLKKNLINYCDGSFSWADEGGFWAETYPSKNMFGKILKSYFTGTQSYETDVQELEHAAILYDSHNIIAQTCWLVILIGILGNLRSNLRNLDIKSFVLLTILGLSVFLLLFEGRSRYLFIYSNYYVVAFALGIDEIIQYNKHVNNC